MFETKKGREKRIIVRVTDEEYLKLKNVASSEGVSMSDFVRASLAEKMVNLFSFDQDNSTGGNSYATDSNGL